MNQEKFLSILGCVATATAMAMYISYIPQISSNLAGHKGDWLQPKWSLGLTVYCGLVMELFARRKNGQSSLRTSRVLSLGSLLRSQPFKTIV